MISGARQTLVLAATAAALSMSLPLTDAPAAPSQGDAFWRDKNSKRASWGSQQKKQAKAERRRRS